MDSRLAHQFSHIALQSVEIMVCKILNLLSFMLHTSWGKASKYGKNSHQPGIHIEPKSKYYFYGYGGLTEN